MGKLDDKSARESVRAERLNQALRANLAKRKALARARKAGASNPAGPGQGTGGTGAAKNLDKE
jgi:hypothetical protein